MQGPGGPRRPAEVNTLQGIGPEATARARELAASIQLGSWHYSLRLERTEDRNSVMNNVVGLVIGLIVATASIAFMLRAHPEAWGIVLVGLVLSGVGLGFVAVCGYRLMFKDREGIRGILLGHVFDAGLIFERTRGQCHVVRLGDGMLRHVSWDDGADDRQRAQLWITLPDGQLRGIETWNKDECLQLSALATHVGLGAEPETIAPLHPGQVPELL
ncbi:hypothetical protein ADIAG_00285 [Paeniglutamicibacter gangotriensis Lz1y]|uniref:Uncharacterized protein n=1 Tax=Paeniglutamicibacter gangotriensis Lz1y TaxID=1276920 RepID=M7MV24_9MICC|nr:hypothetical protein ADIAG_00285 [Paeniglutamicibacter gangotriensis Lz1y]